MEITGGNATLYVADLDRSIEFYTKALGLALRRRASETWAEVVAGDELVLGLHRVDDAAGRVPGSAIRIGLHLHGSLDEAVEQLSAGGVEFADSVVDDGPVRLAFFEDPDGNPLYLCEFVAAPAL